MPTVTYKVIVPDAGVCVGDEFAVTLSMDSSEAINVVDGALRYDPQAITFKEARHGSSFVQYWVTAPGQRESGTIDFTGGLPTPGFAGNDGAIFEARFVAQREGVAGYSIAPETLALLDDGRATEADTEYVAATMEILPRSDESCSGEALRIAETDTEPPLPFEIEITRTDAAFNGDYFASFFTTDAESGVSYYEVMEQSRYVTTQWFLAASPYRLQTQGGNVIFSARAVDHAGNVRTVAVEQSLEARGVMQRVSDMGILMIAGALAVLILWHCVRQRDTDR